LGVGVAHAEDGHVLLFAVPWGQPRVVRLARVGVRGGSPDVVPGARAGDGHCERPRPDPDVV